MIRIPKSTVTLRIDYQELSACACGIQLYRNLVGEGHTAENAESAEMHGICSFSARLSAVQAYRIFFATSSIRLPKDVFPSAASKLSIKRA